MNLAQLNATDLSVLDTRPDHNPTVLNCQTQLQAIWDGEYDDTDTIQALRNVAAKLNALANAITTPAPSRASHTTPRPLRRARYLRGWFDHHME